MPNRTHTTRPRFLITLEAPDDASDPDGTRRLRRWLKQAWRGYCLRCVDIGLAVTKPSEAQPVKDGKAGDGD